MHTEVGVKKMRGKGDTAQMVCHWDGFSKTKY